MVPSSTPRPPAQKLVIASNNLGKLTEIAAILTPLNIEIVPQSVFGVPEAEEPHSTFVENALAKARHASRHTHLPALADDSGICVDALNGAPGVHSARFAEGPSTTRENQDERNNLKLLDLLVDAETRCAHYYCVIVLIRSAQDAQPLICDAEWHGEIAVAPRGSGGFGYDSVFLLPDLLKTSAELAPDHKNRLSHRARALAALSFRLKIDANRDPRCASPIPGIDLWNK